MNDNAIGLIKDILHGENNCYLRQKYKLKDEKVEEYKKRINEYTQPLFYEINKKINQENVLDRLVLHLANGCNLRCVYCYANGGVYNSPVQLISREMVDCVIDRFYSEFDKIKGVQLFGGEPLMNMEIIEYVCDKFRERDPEIEIGIVTNGTLINNKYVDIANRYKIQTTISYDGNIKVNDMLRIRENGTGASSDILMKAKYFQQSTGLLGLIEGTYTQYHFDNKVGVLDILKHLEKEISGVPLHLAPAGGAEQNDFILKDYQPFIDSVDEIFKENKKNSDNNYTYSLLERIVYNVTNRVTCSEYICDAGVGTLSVSVNGDVYPCFMFTDQERNKLGNVKEDNLFSSDKFKSVISEFREFSFKETNKNCSECFIKDICNGCLGLNAMNTNSSGLAMDVKTCDMFRKMTERVLVQLAEISQKGKEGEDNI